MKKYFSLLIMLSIVSGCQNPAGRTWIIPVTIDTSDLSYTPDLLKSFETRRIQLLDSLQEGYVLLHATDQESYNRHGYRPNNYFYYLTGYDAPDTYALLSNDTDHAFILSMPPESIRSLIYTGGSLHASEITDLFGPDTVLSYVSFWHFVDSLLQTDLPVYLDRSDRDLFNNLKQRAGVIAEERFRDIALLVDQMRLLKGPLEVERLQKACDITSLALVKAMKACAPGMFEFEIESVIEGTFLQYGSPMPGFPSITGSGPNSTILHYESNNRIMEAGDLLLMDIGAEYGYYTADISRTIPVNGRFSQEQRIIYQLVLDAQKAAIERLRPGNMPEEGHMAARDVIAEGLYQLGLITDTMADWQVQFYMLHRFSHYLGLDVHDVGNYGGARIESSILEPGMVLTIEPGLYFREEGLDQLPAIFGNRVDSTELVNFARTVGPVYARYINTGVRIEDDILITRDGNIILSRYAPKEIADIEQLMR